MLLDLRLRDPLESRSTMMVMMMVIFDHQPRTKESVVALEPKESVTSTESPRVGGTHPPYRL
jgi:hypothetical protein